MSTLRQVARTSPWGLGYSDLDGNVALVKRCVGVSQSLTVVCFAAGGVVIESAGAHARVCTVYVCDPRSGAGPDQMRHSSPCAAVSLPRRLIASLNGG